LDAFLRPVPVGGEEGGQDGLEGVEAGVLLAASGEDQLGLLGDQHLRGLLNPADREGLKEGLFIVSYLLGHDVWWGGGGFFLDK
jgi:hypothetical protein